MSTETVEQARKLRLLEARLVSGSGPGSVSVRVAAPSPGVMYAAALGSGSGSSVEDDVLSFSSSGTLSQADSGGGIRTNQKQSEMECVAKRNRTSTPSLLPRSTSSRATPNAPTKRRRRTTNNSSPNASSLRDTTMDSYFKPKPRDASLSKDSAAVPPHKHPPPPQTPVRVSSLGNLQHPTPSTGRVKRTLAFATPSATPTAGATGSAHRGGAVSNGSVDADAVTASDADAYGHLRRMIEKLREEKEKLVQEAKEINAENEDLRTQVQVEFPALKEEVEEMKSEKEKVGARAKKLEAALKEAVVGVARAERAEKRREAAKMSERVGRLGVERSRTSLQEVWEEGAEWRAVTTKLKDIQEAREELDKKRREVVKMKASQSKADGSTTGKKSNGQKSDEAMMMPPPPLPGKENSNEVGVPFVNTTAYLLEQEEIYKVQLQTLKREEGLLLEQRSRLARERDVLIRELRRQSDEDISSFNKFQTVNGRYVLLTLLGRGGFSEVYKGFDLLHARPVACKIHQLASNWSEEKKRTFIRHSMREYEIHKSLRHPRVVQLIDIFEIDENTFCTVLEYCNGSDLDSYLRAHQTVIEREARSIISQVVSGLVYLSEQRKRIIHYDLKPGNILFDNGEVRIADFGLSKIMSEDSSGDGMDLTSQGAGTMWYLPPECFETSKQARINSKVDVWSAGVILYQMLYGRKPFGHDQTQEKMFREKTVSKQELKFPAKPVVSEPAKDFMRSCLTRNVVDRPNVHQLVQHPFLRKR